MVTLPVDAASDADLVAGLIRAGDGRRAHQHRGRRSRRVGRHGRPHPGRGHRGRSTGPGHDGPGRAEAPDRSHRGRPRGGADQAPSGSVGRGGAAGPRGLDGDRRLAGPPVGDRDGSVTPAVLAVDPSWLARLEVDDEVRVRDLRGRDRLLRGGRPGGRSGPAELRPVLLPDRGVGAAAGQGTPRPARRHPDRRRRGRPGWDPGPDRGLLRAHPRSGGGMRGAP